MIPADDAAHGAAPGAALAPGVPGPGRDLDLFGRPPKRHADWSHRRGEPRGFAFAWMLFLMGATALMFTRAGLGGPFSSEAFRFAGREALLVVLVGMGLLWPLIRLSQVTPMRGPVRTAVLDVLLVVIPAQALVWPHLWLARWPLQVVLACGALLVIWGLATGLVLGVTFARKRMNPAGGRGRILAMLTCVGLLGAGTVPVLFSGPARPADRLDARVSWMFSPLTSLIELTRDRAWSGQSAAIAPAHWRVLWAQGGLVAAGWGVLGLARSGRR